MKSKKKLIAIIISLIVIAAGAAFAYVYFFTDMFKTPEELFYKYVGKAAKTETEYGYQDMLDDLKTAETKSYKAKSTIGVELKAKGTGYTSRKDQAVYDMINGVSLDVETKSKPDEKKAEYDIKVKYDGDELTQLQLVKDKDLYGIKSEFLDSNFVAIENDNLKDLAKKLGMSNSAIPDKFEFLDLYDLLYISKEDQQKIEDTYKNVVKNTITSDKFKKVENVIQQINGVDKKTTVYALSINEKEYYSLMLKVLETAKEDDLTLNLIVDKVNSFLEKDLGIKNYAELSTSSKYLKTTKKITNKLTKEELADQLNNTIKELNKQIEKADESSVVEFVVYVADGETVRMEIKSNNEIKTAVDFYNVNDKKHVVFYAQEQSKSTYSRYSYSKSSSGKLVKVMEMEYKVTKNGDEKRTEGDIVAYTDEEEIMKMTFDVTTKGKNGQGKSSTAAKVGIELEKLSMEFTINSEIDYTDNVEIESLNNRNSTILNDMSKTEIEKFFNGVSVKAQRVLGQKMEDLGINY